jgi:putative aldouronate transport system permease protein
MAMVQDRSLGSRIFDALNILFLSAVGITCFLPIWHLFSISLSDKSAVGGGLVFLWPVRFTPAAYQKLMENAAFFQAGWISILRTVVGSAVNMTLIILLSYPLAQPAAKLRYRNLLSTVVVITMYFSAGLIPTYMVVYRLGLLNSFWAMILPSAVPVFSVIILMNFFRNQPKELEEAGIIDGATPFQILTRIALPIAQPALATLLLFALLHHWNSWFDGLIYFHKPSKYPLQTFLYGQIAGADMSIRIMTTGDVDQLAQYYNQETLRAAQIFLATLPIIIVYPLLQKHFVKGIVLGSVKG